MLGKLIRQNTGKPWLKKTMESGINFRDKYGHPKIYKCRLQDKNLKKLRALDKLTWIF